MKPREITEMDKEDRDEEEEEEEDEMEEESTDEQISDEVSTENSDKEDLEVKDTNTAAVDGNSTSEGSKPRSYAEALNDYLESIFSTEEEKDEEVSLINFSVTLLSFQLFLYMYFFVFVFLIHGGCLSYKKRLIVFSCVPYNLLQCLGYEILRPV